MDPDPNWAKILDLDLNSMYGTYLDQQHWLVRYWYLCSDWLAEFRVESDTVKISCSDDAISAPNVPGREPGADSVATNKDGIEVEICLTEISWIGEGITGYPAI